MNKVIMGRLKSATNRSEVYEESEVLSLEFRQKGKGKRVKKRTQKQEQLLPLLL